MSRISSKILEKVPSANRLGSGGPPVKSSLAPLSSLPARCWFCDGLLTWPSPPLPARLCQIQNPHKLFGFRIFGFLGKIFRFSDIVCVLQKIFPCDAGSGRRIIRALCCADAVWSQDGAPCCAVALYRCLFSWRRLPSVCVYKGWQGS